jgi:Arc/MetJ-type ribon-helix-helix transcriptional regulator
MVMGCQGGLGTPMRRWLVAESDTAEKITINVGIIDPGQIDLLVREGFYTNRTDFIRNQLRASGEAVTETAARKALVLGTEHYSRSDLEELRPPAAGCTFGYSVWPASAPMSRRNSHSRRFASVEVLGAFRASPAVKAALAPRTT